MHDCCKNKVRIRTEEEKKNITVRLNKIIGQLNGIKNMVSDDRYCDDILIQLAAVDKSIKSLSSIVLENHMRTCVVDNIKNDNLEVIDEIVDLFKRFN